MSTTEYQVQIYDTLYNMKLPSDQHCPHAPHAAMYAVRHHYQMLIHSVRRWRVEKGYWYIVELQDGRTVPCVVKRLKAKERNDPHH